MYIGMFTFFYPKFWKLVVEDKRYLRLISSLGGSFNVRGKGPVLVMYVEMCAFYVCGIFVHACT